MEPPGTRQDNQEQVRLCKSKLLVVGLLGIFWLIILAVWISSSFPGWSSGPKQAPPIPPEAADVYHRQ